MWFKNGFLYRHFPAALIIAFSNFGNVFSQNRYERESRVSDKLLATESVCANVIVQFNLPNQDSQIKNREVANGQLRSFFDTAGLEKLSLPMSRRTRELFFLRSPSCQSRTSILEDVGDANNLYVTSKGIVYRFNNSIRSKDRLLSILNMPNEDLNLANLANDVSAKPLQSWDDVLENCESASCEVFEWDQMLSQIEPFETTLETISNSLPMMRHKWQPASASSIVSYGPFATIELRRKDSTIDRLIMYGKAFTGNRGSLYFSLNDRVFELDVVLSQGLIECSNGIRKAFEHSTGQNGFKPSWDK